MPELEFLIKTPAELAGAKSAADALERDIGKAKALGDELDKLQPKLQRLEAARQRIAVAEQAQTAAERQRLAIQHEANIRVAEANARIKASDIGQHAHGFTTPAAAAAAAGSGGLGIGGVAVGNLAADAASAALTKLKDIIIAGVIAAERSRIENEKLSVALNNQGFAAETLMPKYQALTDALQEATGIGNDEWIPVLTKLTQFGSTPESIGMDVNVVKSLAGFVGDVSGATEAWGKALQGNFSFLQRYGFHVDEAASHIDKLRQAEEQIHRRGFGQLETEKGGLIGYIKQVKNESEEAAKSISMLALAHPSGQFFISYLDGLVQFSKMLRGEFRRIGEEAAHPVDIAAAAQARAEPAGKAFQRTQEETAKATEKVTRALERQIAATRGIQQAQDEITDAQMALKLAEVDAKEKTGGIDQVGAITERKNIRQQAAIARQQHMETANMGEIQVIRRQREETNIQLLEILEALKKATREHDYETKNFARKRLAEVEERKAAGLAREQELMLQITTGRDVVNMQNQAIGIGAGADVELARDRQARDAIAAQKAMAERNVLSRDLTTRMAGRAGVRDAGLQDRELNLRRAPTLEGRARIQAEGELDDERSRRENDEDLQHELDKAKRTGGRHRTDIRAVGDEVNRGFAGLASETAETLGTLADTIRQHSRELQTIRTQFANARA